MLLRRTARISLSFLCVLIISVLSCVAGSSNAAFAQDDDGQQQQRPKAPKQDYFVRLDTTKGPIVMRVFYTVVPYTAGHFLELVQKGFYNGLTFHRVEPWVVQGGDPTGTGRGNYTDPDGNPVFLTLETTPKLTHNSAGMVAMARSAAPNSASCQFYIIKAPTPSLNGKYSVFAQVVEGLETVFDLKIGDRILRAKILMPERNDEQEEGPQQQEAVPSARTPQPPPGQSGF